LETTTTMATLRNLGKSHLILTVLALIALAILISLGNWQMRRLAWKEGLISTIAMRAEAEPVPLEEALDRWRVDGEIEYLPVHVAGTFHHDKEQYYYAPSTEGPGWNVYTPLETEDGKVVFINRGFVADAVKDPATRPQGQLPGIVGLVGLARAAPKEKPNSFVPDNDVAGNAYYWPSLAEMATAAGYDPNAETLVPFFLDAKATEIRGGWPRGGTTRVELPNKHLGYAITWYGLALTLVGVYGAFMWKAWRGPEKTDA